MKALLIPMQIHSELRIKKTGEVVVDNPEIELAPNRRAADAMLSYRLDETTGEHVLQLLDPVADHKHLREHRPDD